MKRGDLNGAELENRLKEDVYCKLLDEIYED